jgi:hypothetical protein
MGYQWKANIVQGRVKHLLPKDQFDADDKHFIITLCANPQDIVEFNAYTEEGARNIAEFMAEELYEDYHRLDRTKSYIINTQRFE